MQLKPWITYVAVATVGLFAAWYWFIREPDDPFAVPEPKQILADPKVPPDQEQPDSSPEVTEAVKHSRETESTSDEVKCPPGDPMCGGL